MKPPSAPTPPLKTVPSRRAERPPPFFPKYFFLVVLLRAFLLVLPRGWRSAEAGLPIVLHRWWEFIQVREQHRDLPHLGFGKSLIPGGHAGVANAGAHGVEGVP